MKRIHFTQQKPYDYYPLMAGLGLVTEKELKDYETEGKAYVKGYPSLCPKLYTARTHPLSGEYCVVEGSRFKAKPVEPRIDFQISEVYRLDLNTAKIISDDWNDGLWRDVLVIEDIVNGDRYSFPELDLGIKGATFEQLRDELLRLNPKATIDTPFYVSKLEPVEVQS